MRRIAALFIPVMLAWLVAIVPAAWGQSQPQQPPPQQPAPQQPAPQQPAPPVRPAPAPALPAPRTIVPGQGLAGVSIGSSIRLVIARFGNPSAVRETTVDAVYFFNRWGIVVYAKDEVVTAVSTTNSLLKIDDVLGVGYRAESAMAAYGRGFKEGPVEGFPGLVYNDRGVAFGMDGTTIATVLVFRPGAAAEVSGLQIAAQVGRPGPQTTGYPQVTGLAPFSPETNYMSLPGYLRWVSYQVAGSWIGYPEAARIVRQQLEGR
jgi:hypothetical protein